MLPAVSRWLLIKKLHLSMFLGCSEGGHLNPCGSAPLALSFLDSATQSGHLVLWLDEMSPRLRFILYHLAASPRGINVYVPSGNLAPYIMSTNCNNFIPFSRYHVDLTYSMIWNYSVTPCPLSVNVPCGGSPTCLPLASLYT